MKINKIKLTTLVEACVYGWQTFRSSLLVSMIYSLFFEFIGLCFFAAIQHIETAPMLLPLAGGFMLIGPIFLVGYFNVAQALANRRAASFGQLFEGFSKINRGFWVISFVCMLLFIIWITDIGILYGFLVRHDPLPITKLFPPPVQVHLFIFWCIVMGFIVGLITFAISVFSVPLLHQHRANLVAAVIFSAQAFFINFLVLVTWAILLTVTIVLSIFIKPLFVVTFPVLAYASFALYLAVFPPTINKSADIAID